MEQQERALLLRNVPMFKTLSDSVFTTLSNTVKLKIVNEGDIIIREGEEATRFWIVNEGECILQKRQAATSRQIYIGTVKKFEYFGEYPLVSENCTELAMLQYPYTAKAKSSSCSLLSFPLFNAMLFKARLNLAQWSKIACTPGALELQVQYNRDEREWRDFRNRIISGLVQSGKHYK
jgi:CRP-like cAMP-binding protein